MKSVLIPISLTSSFMHVASFCANRGEKQHKNVNSNTMCFHFNVRRFSVASNRHKRWQQISLRDDFKRKRNVNFSTHVAQITTNASLMCLKWSNLCASDQFSNYPLFGVFSKVMKTNKMLDERFFSILLTERPRVWDVNRFVNFNLCSSFTPKNHRAKAMNSGEIR